MNAYTPVTGAWRETDPVGRRKFLPFTDLELDNGGYLSSGRIAYETWGKLNASGTNAVLVLHALTGDSHASGSIEEGHIAPGWWDSLIGPGKAIDTNKYFVVCPNALGGCQGSTGPSSIGPDGRRWGGRFPQITVRDITRAEYGLLDHLGIPAWHGVIGGSVGGMRALEWALTYPRQVKSLSLIATNARSTADQIAFSQAQIAAIEADQNYRGGDYYDSPLGLGPHAGLSAARQIAHITYRSGLELQARFGRNMQADEDPLHGGRYQVQSYLQHHGAKLSRRFDAGSYVRLSQAFITHNVTRDRGSLHATLARYTGRLQVIAVSSDRLFLPEQSAEIVAAANLSRLDDPIELQLLHTPHGHDGFLIEAEDLGELVEPFFDFQWHTEQVSSY